MDGVQDTEQRRMRMTENETIDKLNNLHYKILHSSFCSMVYESEIEALCMAKDVLKEIQQYRAIGTIEEFKALKEKNTPLEHHHTRIDDINDKVRVSVCPSCLSIIFTQSEEYPNFCVACGQKLDWSE